MHEAFDDEDSGSRWVLWGIFLVLVAVSIAAVALTWRSAGFDRMVASFGFDRSASGVVPMSHVGAAGARSGDAGERIGDWFVDCEGEATRCSLMQTVRPADDLSASWRIERTDAGELIGVWTLPTGVKIGRGMQLAFDDGEPSVVPYDSCAQSSCEVRARLGPDFIDLMRSAGTTASTVTLKDGATQTYAFSHDGLPAGLDRLAAAKPR